MTPLALHACCGPCSLEPVRLLREQGFEPTIIWTNPNIQPVSEHLRRLDTLRSWAADVAHVDVIVAGDDRAAWERSVAPHGWTVTPAAGPATRCALARPAGLRPSVASRMCPPPLPSLLPAL